MLMKTKQTYLTCVSLGENKRFGNMDSELIENTEIQRLPLTQSEKKSQNKYAWAVLFSRNVNLKEPFSLVKLRDMLNTNFPWKIIKGEMSFHSRMQIHELPCLPNPCYIFAKIQYGMYKWIF